jgi:hypothetical protein
MGRDGRFEFFRSGGDWDIGRLGRDNSRLGRACIGLGLVD